MKIILGHRWGFSFTRGLANFERNRLDRWLSIVLIIVILGVLSAIGYLVTQPNVGEKFTEFFILGVNGQAADYPTDFTLENGQVVSVEYGSVSTGLAEQWGRVTIGIVNHEGQGMIFTITMEIDGLQVSIPFQGGTVDQIGPITLSPEEKWEQEIGIVPQHTGDNQNVEILLSEEGGSEPYLSLILWINVR